ncbi:hypothetical protein [Ktedonobacter racemifer]|uniref:Uncharacterized protein n=1 Tax=Ktedonobacter racemifer DSM 44963 TaxID=485913 RepID=D6TS30_KTERA|nr:hypothetical protein [Ktedonobacter racemifer]EFH86103.1 hypothetical protein Krac_7375 [Ktedonobacter racemifer DSM 44963]
MLSVELVYAVKQAFRSEAPASKSTPPTDGNCCDPESGCCSTPGVLLSRI